MKKLKSIFAIMLLLCTTIVMCFNAAPRSPKHSANAKDTAKTYFMVYDNEDKSNLLFTKGEDVNSGDMYLSKDNKLYEITTVDENNKTAIAKFIRDEKLPEYNVSPKSVSANVKKASAGVTKKVGVYHTHNDESYYTPDGIDSVYGKGGIHDVGKAFVSNLQKLGIEVVYREDLHLPHNSGAYTRSQVTASAILQSGVNGIFDLHRDSTARKYYLTKVNGKEMSSVRMVIGRSSANFEENQKFAYSIKAYADKAYPGFIKDIYIGKGNYNQQLSTRAMLFEMGCENIEKDLVIRSTETLAKVIDVVLYGSNNASNYSLNDVSLNNNNGQNNVIEGLAVSDTNATVNSNTTLWIVLGVVGGIILIFAGLMIFSKKIRYSVCRFFSEMFAGLFGKKKKTH